MRSLIMRSLIDEILLTGIGSCLVMMLAQRHTIGFNQSQLRMLSELLDMVHFLDGDWLTFKQTIFTERMAFDKPRTKLLPVAVITTGCSRATIEIGCWFTFVFVAIAFYLNVLTMWESTRFHWLVVDRVIFQHRTACAAYNLWNTGGIESNY